MTQKTKEYLLSILALGLTVVLLPGASNKQIERKSTPDQNAGRGGAAVGTGSNLVFNLRHVKQGFGMKLEMDNGGALGYVTYLPRTNASRDSIGLEYPVNQKIEHIYGGGIWVAGQIDTSVAGNRPKIKRVTTAYEGYGPSGGSELFEFYPGQAAADSFWVGRKGDSFKPAGWDAYWGPTYPFKPISDNDLYCVYTDDGTAVANHIALHLKIIQSSYAWTDPYAEAIIINEYKIINTGPRTLDSVFIGFFMDADVGPVNVNQFERNNFTGYYPGSYTAYIHNPLNRGSTPVGVTLLWANGPGLGNLRYTFQWYPLASSPLGDGVKYDMMASGVVRSDEYPALSDTRFLFSFGAPFSIRSASGPTPDTLKIAIAIVSGTSRTRDPRTVMQLNARRALDIYLNQGIRLPATPPSPPLRTEVGFRKVTLDWRWRPGDDIPGPGKDPRIYGRPDPEQNWDSTSRLANHDPLRRSNPPPGYDSTIGGRNFEAYRIWRSEDPDYPDKSFTLLKQFDVKVPNGYPDTLSFEYDTGLEPYTFVDTNLVRGHTYVYAVTSVSIPNVVERRNPDSTTSFVYVEPLESSKLVNATPVGKDKQLPFSVANEVGKVSVVPNPYRTDRDYTKESGGYEGKTGDWDENSRLIKFINLPVVCTIRIFSLSGDLIRTVEHDGGLGSTFPQGDENVSLVSESNRALASGIYLYTVESQFGVQTGKFVIIR